MIILSIDSSSKCLSVALKIDNSIDQNCVNDERASKVILIEIDKILKKYHIKRETIDYIVFNRGPGSFAGIRNSFSIVKAFNLTNNIDYYCYSVQDFKGEKDIKYENIPDLCEKFNIKKNLINPIYLS